MELKPGYKQTEVGVIPEDWNVCDLGDAVEFLDGLRKPIKSSDRAKIRGVYPYYGASGIVDYVNGYIFDEELILLGEDGENILSRNLPLAFRVSGKIWVNNHAHVMRPKKAFSIGYLTEFLESRDYSLLNSGTAQPKLNKQTCLKIKIAQPTKTEQTAIANALSDVDALIQSLTRLIAKKRQIKQGAMQTLLNPYENGHLKAGWVVKKLGDICENITTGRLDANAMIENGEYSFFTCAKQVYRINHFAFNYEALLVSGNGANVGYIHYFKGKFNAYQRTYVLSGFKCDVHYLKVFMERNLQNRIKVEVNAGNTPYIVMGTLTGMDVLLPENETEQTRIATILSDMDAEIAALETKLAKYRQIKQGMMQNLLTGRIRLVKPESKTGAAA